MIDPTSFRTELERLLLVELFRAWREENRERFRGAMTPPQLALNDADDVLAHYRPRERGLVFSRSLLRTASWSAVLEVLRHEMAHQYVAEVLRVLDEPPHGPAFQRVCAARGIDASCHGLPDATAPVDADRERLVRRVKKLLALGGSPNEHEAQAAMRAAQRLVLEHNLAALHEVSANDYAARQLGDGQLRTPAHERILSGILARHFLVRTIWVPVYFADRAKYGRALEISGTHANLELAEYVHTYVLRTAERAWKQWRRADPERAKGQRSRYLLGVMLGFQESLREQERVNQQTGLVWVGDPGLEAWVGRRYPRLSRGRTITYYHTDALHQGKAEGRRLKIHRGLPEDPTQRGRLLG